MGIFRFWNRNIGRLKVAAHWKNKCLTETGPKAHRISNINLNNTISCKGWALNDTLQLEFILNNTKEIAECSDEMNNKHKYSLKKMWNIHNRFIRSIYAFIVCWMYFFFQLISFFSIQEMKNLLLFWQTNKEKRIEFLPMICCNVPKWFVGQNSSELLLFYVSI